MRTKHFALTTLAATAMLAANPTRAVDLVISNVVVDAMIRAGSSSAYKDVPSYEMTSTNGGVVEVKLGSSTGTSSTTRKSYFQFNIPADANTNANALFKIVFPSAFSGIKSDTQNVLVWALNQAYTFSPTTIWWNNAMAQTNASPSWLLATTGGDTATPIATNVVPAASEFNRDYTFTLPGGTNLNAWGRFVKNGAITLVLLADTTYGASAYAPVRILTTNSTLSFYMPAPGTTTLPLISSIPNISGFVNVNSVTNSLTVSATVVGDPQATSDNETVLPAYNVFFGGSGASRTVYVLPTAGGVANVNVTVYDNLGNPAQANFTVTVQDNPIVILDPKDTNTLVGTAVTVPFKAYRRDGPATDVTVTATSLNTNVVADANLTVAVVPDTGGTNRTVTVTPLPGATGLAPIALWASYGDYSNRVAFGVVVTPSKGVVFVDSFNYTTNLTSGGSPTINDGVGRLDYASGGYWDVRNGTGTKIMVTNSAALLVRQSGTTPQSLVAALVGAPYTNGQGAVLYTSFKATWPGVPMDSGSFVHLFDKDPLLGGTTGLVARVSTSVSNSPLGQFRVRTENGQNAAGSDFDTEFPVNLSVGTNYTIVTRYDVSGAATRLWVDPVDVNSASVDAPDIVSSLPVTDVGLRQGTDTGPVLIDDLKVVLADQPQITAINLVNSGADVQINFTADTAHAATDFKIQVAGNLTDAFQPVSATFSGGAGVYSATLPASGNQPFYRVAAVRFW